ncbi:uncharacterized protein DUF4407 [Micromonospora palomenae]|uniref:Uncharacterized protein DUF4407 n=2 Tax=Micromonospora palomenae TaxID=1461247 RepID=A0A561VHD0_9ACTN|nr:uncharacterized protein DUF4407 [Micromonospora palomenae]
MGLKRALAAVAGGQRSLLQTTPADELRYAAMGGVIVSTALVAAASAAMAVHMALRMPIALAVMVGVVWGFIIFNLDRLLVVQMMRQKNKWMTAVMAVPRVMLALVLGAVISTPVVLQIFGPEIKTELGVLHAERIAEYNRNTANNPDYASIPALEKSVADDEKIVAGGVALNVEMDPAVVEVRKQYDAAQARFEQAQKNVVCEKEGTCGSGNPGAGIAYDEKLRIQAEARRTRDEVLRRLDTARATAQAAQQTAQSEAAAAARGRLEQNQKRLAALKAQLDADKKAHEADSKKDTGLLARLEALDELSADRPTLRTAHITLFLLFLALELLPVLMKVLQLVGPETDYDKVTREHSDHLLQLDRERRAMELKAEQDRLQRTADAAIASNQVVVDAQTMVMTKVLAAWQQFAVEQADNDLRRWLQQAPSSDVPSLPSASQQADARQSPPELEETTPDPSHSLEPPDTSVGQSAIYHSARGTSAWPPEDPVRATRSTGIGGQPIRNGADQHRNGAAPGGRQDPQTTTAQQPEKAWTGSDEGRTSGPAAVAPGSGARRLGERARRRLSQARAALRIVARSE